MVDVILCLDVSVDVFESCLSSGLCHDTLPSVFLGVYCYGALCTFVIILLVMSVMTRMGLVLFGPDFAVVPFLQFFLGFIVTPHTFVSIPLGSCLLWRLWCGSLGPVSWFGLTLSRYPLSVFSWGLLLWCIPLLVTFLCHVCYGD